MINEMEIMFEDTDFGFNEKTKLIEIEIEKVEDDKYYNEMIEEMLNKERGIE